MGKLGDRVRKGESNVVTSDQKTKAEKELSTEDKIRLGAAGLLMDFADEGEAFLESMFSGDSDLPFSERYKKNLIENQEALKSARSKDGSLKYEIGGAVIPGLLTLPLGGAGFAPTAGRVAGTLGKTLFGGTKRKLATTGAVQGGITSVGSQEDADILSRVDDFGDLARIGKNMALGGGLSVAGGKAVEKGVQAVTKLGAGKLLRSITNELGKPVEDELKRIATVSGKSVDEIILNIKKGQIIPEMDLDIAKAVRGFVAQSSEGGAIISQKARERASQKKKDVFEGIQTDLAPNTELSNVQMFYKKSVEQLQKEEGEAYKSIFKNPEFTNANYEGIGKSLIDLVQNRPNLGARINDFLEDAGVGKLVKEVTDDAGKPVLDNAGRKTFQLTKNVNLEASENIKRALMGFAEEVKLTNKPRYNIFKDLEDGFRKQIDEISPDLKSTRQNWANIMNGKTAFKDGEKAFGKTIDDFENMLDDVYTKMDQTGDQTLLETFRLGYVSSLRKKSGTASTKSFIKSLADDEMNARKNLEAIYPEESFDEILRKVAVADGSLMLLKQVDELSPTAKTIIDAGKVGQKQDLADLTQISSSLALTAQGIPNAGFMAPVRNLFTKYIKGADGLTEQQMSEVATLLISDNPNIIKAALTDVGARNELIRNAQIIANTYITGGASASAIVGTSKASSGDGLPIIGTAFAEEINKEDYKPIKELSSSISPKTREKILGLQ